MQYVVSCLWFLFNVIKFIKDSWRKFKRNEYLTSVCKLVRDSSWFTSTLSSFFSAKIALISHANLCGYIWVTEKCGFLEVRAPRKSWRSESQSESKGPHCYGTCSHVPAGLPRGEVIERSEDQGEGKGPHRYGPCSPSPVYLQFGFLTCDQLIIT